MRVAPIIRAGSFAGKSNWNKLHLSNAEQPAHNSRRARAFISTLIAGAAAFSVALAASPALAQPPSPTPTAPASNLEQLRNLSLEDLMEVHVATETTASKQEEKVSQAPGMVIVIDKNDIRLRGYSTLTDVLKDLPGMDLSSNFFSELGTQVSVRGIPSNNLIVVLVNGMRVNPPGGEYFPFRNDISVRDAEQIEVIYGSGSTLYGQDAISAVINIKTKTPPADGHPSVEVTADGGLNYEREVYASFGKVFDTARNIFINGYVQYHDSDLTRLDRAYPAWWQQFKDAAAPRRQGTVPDREDFGLNAFLQVQLGDFSVQSWYRDSKRSSAEGYGLPALAYLPQAIWEDRSWVTEARHHWKMTDKVALDSTISYNWYQIDPDSRYVEALTPTQFNFDDHKYGVGRSINFEETMRIDFTKSLSLLIGGTFGRYDIIPKSTVPGGATPGSDSSIISQGGNYVYYTQLGDPASIHTIPRVVDVKYNRYGAYIEPTWKITPKLKLILGGRVDKDTRIDQPSFTPRASIIYDVTDSLTVKYTYSWAYVSPASYFGFATYDRGDILNVSNPALKPETSKTHEIDLNYHKEAFDLGLSLYYGNESNLILVSDVGSGPNIILNTVYLDLAGTQKRELTESVNSGESRNAGLDFYGKAKLTRSLTTWFSYSYTTYEQTTAGMISGLQGISQNNFRLGLTWAITPKLFVTPSLVARSTPRNVIGGPLAEELEYPWEADLHILYKPTNNLEFYATLRNLTNNHYALTGFVGEAIPQETFNGVMGVRLSF